MRSRIDYENELSISLVELVELLSKKEDDYLTRGRKLMTLAKEYTEKIKESLFEGIQKDIMEFNITNPDRLKIFSRIRSEVRKYLSQIEDKESPAAIELFRATGGVCEIYPAPEMNSYVRTVALRRCREAYGDTMLGFTIWEQGVPIYSGYGLKNTQWAMDRQIVLYGGMFVPEDISTIVSYCIIRDILNRFADIEEELPFLRDTFIFSEKFGSGGKLIKDICLSNRIFHSDSCVYKTLKAFTQFYIAEHEKMRQIAMYKRSASDYAQSYQTKKNIPKATLKRMEESILNKHFGFVEYDSEVSLDDKLKDFELQFLAFKDTYFKSVDCTDNSIRFRKLGNHKASGLYYPGVKCLVVDFRILTSTVHEFGHLIDFSKGSLSLQSDFFQVRNRYREILLRAAADKSNSMYKILNSKNKYNIEYYLEPSEVFARSFELYCSIVLGIKNDLLPNDFTREKTVYPYEDEKYMGAITDYFNKLFGIETEELKAV